MDIFDWILQEIAPAARTSEDLIYEHMASQSGRSLPVIYQPFDPTHPGHWRDRGAMLDFVLATQATGGRVLDFGPGDGWPALIIAPLVAEVVGVEGAHRRVNVCRENAARLGVSNAHFEFVEPGDPLPFPNESFDAVVAASSVEQAPDPRATLSELYRVLKPGGRARLVYEALGRYRDGQEREAWVWAVDETTTKLVLYDRQIAAERAIQVVLTYNLAKVDILAALGQGGEIHVSALTPERLASLSAHLIDAGKLTTHHPSGATLRDWLLDSGFRGAYGTYSASHVAGALFDALRQANRPRTLSAIDAYLRPIAEVTVELRAPLSQDPPITAVK
jgi:SAM-dependent methyltransferase